MWRKALCRPTFMMYIFKIGLAHFFPLWYDYSFRYYFMSMKRGKPTVLNTFHREQRHHGFKKMQKVAIFLTDCCKFLTEVFMDAHFLFFPNFSTMGKFAPQIWKLIFLEENCPTRVKFSHRLKLRRGWGQLLLRPLLYGATVWKCGAAHTRRLLEEHLAGPKPGRRLSFINVVTSSTLKWLTGQRRSGS